MAPLRLVPHTAQWLPVRFDENRHPIRIDATCKRPSNDHLCGPRKQFIKAEKYHRKQKDHWNSDQ